MTHLEDVELGRRLKALRVEPPETGFEARLADRLLALEPDARQAAAARVIVGPWLRRGPVRLIGATALLLAGAAAAMEGGVVEWVQARVFQQGDASAPPSPAAEVALPAARRERGVQLERAPAPVTPELTEAAPLPAVPLARPDHADAPDRVPPPLESLTPRAEPERTALRPAREALVRERSGMDLRSAGAESIRVPRVVIERRSGERAGLEEPRIERQRPGVERLGAERRLERLRDVARQRRERGAGERGERAPSLERLRERRERWGERRDGAGERERRERGGR